MTSTELVMGASGKAQRKLGWHPQPVECAIAQAMDYYLSYQHETDAPDGR